jgi:hypothetical protein
MTEITPYASGSSPFDAIRRVRPDGSEYWSARELMPLLGYDQWRRFAGAIERAQASCVNTGSDLQGNFAGADNNSLELVGRPSADYHLSRYACYLVAMNGDPRKPEIAAAQAYFVVRAREAEVRSVKLTVELLFDKLLELAVEERKDELIADASKKYIVSGCARVMSLHGHGKREQSAQAFVQMTIELDMPGFEIGSAKAILGSEDARRRPRRLETGSTQRKRRR